MDQRMNWVKSLQVGDIVEDCNYKAQEIIGIEESFMTEPPTWAQWILFRVWLPTKLHVSIWDWFETNLGQKVLRDRYLSFADGTSCSAYNCASEIEELSSDELEIE